MRAIHFQDLGAGKRGGLQNSPLRVRTFRSYRTSRARISRLLRAGLPVLGLTLSLLALIGSLFFAYFYNYYASMVDGRIASGFWHSRSGIYAAPVKLSVGRRASLESVVERLRRSGYIEGGTSDGVWNGSFVVDRDRIQVTPNPVFSTSPATTEIKFAGNKIKSIEQSGKQLESYALEPEMLTGRTEAKEAGARVLSYGQIPEQLKNAIIVAEDQRFFDHYGIDPKGVIRALMANIGHSQIKQGGSTITQQLVKNTFLSPEKSLRRKFAEAFLALALERRMSKQQIFALYCNEIYLGQYGSSGIQGVEQAAHAYFGKNLDQLNLAESAAIAAMIKNPNRFAPPKDGPEAVSRRQWIIQRMGEEGMANASDVASSASAHLELAPPKHTASPIAPYFVDAAAKELNTKFTGDYLNSNFNMRVYTTIDTGLQSLAEAAVANGLAKLDRSYAKTGKRLEAALVALDPQNGHVLAVVGERNYMESQFDRATDAYRQPGSTFKPFVYAAALEHGYTPISLFDDRPVEFKIPGSGSYEPGNYGDSYSMTRITMKTALTKSSNVVAVQTALATGLSRVAEKAEDFGFQKVESYPSMALGTTGVTPLQLAAGYATFANGGRRPETTFVDQVSSAENSTLYVSAPEQRQVVKEQTAYMITDMLDSVVERGTARTASGALGKDVAFVGKTGSSKDGWFAGYTPNLVAVVWVGTDDNVDIGATGGEVALPIWVDFMKAAVQSRPEYGGDSFPMPSGLKEVVVDPTTGMLADKYCPLTEKVVVPASVVSNIKCLLHQPPPEPVASSDPGALPTTVITIPPAESKEDSGERFERPYIDEDQEPSPLRDEDRKKPKSPGPQAPPDDTYYQQYEKRLRDRDRHLELR